MKDTLAMIGYGSLLVMVIVVGGILAVLFIAAMMATLALPIVLIIWAVGALL